MRRAIDFTAMQDSYIVEICLPRPGILMHPIITTIVSPNVVHYTGSHRVDEADLRLISDFARIWIRGDSVRLSSCRCLAGV